MRTTRTAAAAIAAIALALTGCGDDGDDTEAAEDPTPTTAGEAGLASSGPGDSQLADYCGAVLAMETATPPEFDEAAPPEEQAAVLQTFAAEVIVPLMDDAMATVPEAARADAEVVGAAVDEVATGNVAAWDEPDVVAAGARLHDHDVEACGWASQPVTATEYAFDGLPAELPAGPVSFELANEGAEVHELLVIRKNDGVEQSFDELLALPPEEAMQLATVVGQAFATPGGSEYAVADLTPGEHLVACFVPEGMTGEESVPAEDALPHALHGMTSEFTVA